MTMSNVIEFPIKPDADLIHMLEKALAAAQATTPRRTWRSVCRLHVSARRTISTDECTRCRRYISLVSPQLLASLPSGRRVLTTGGHTHAVLHS